MKKDHFWFTCVAQKRLCLSSLIPGCAQSLHPRELAFFFALDGKFPGMETICRGGEEKRGQTPRPPATLQHFSLIAQSNSAIFSTLMCNFFSINVFLCINNARILTGADYRFLILIKTSCRDDTCLWF